MSKPHLLPLFFLFSISLFSQSPIPSAYSTQDGNNINAMFLNGGDLFWDGDNGLFTAPADDPIPKASIFAAGLWMGGIAENGQLKLAAQTYGRANDSFDYSPGPIRPDGTTDVEQSSNFNKIWKATKAEIDSHKADFSDNGVIDNPIQSIFEWPGRSNYSFFDYNGFPLPNYSADYAPFHDTNGNNIYEPELGDFPHAPNTISELIPISINWTIFNDSTTHNQTGGAPILAEVHLTSWSFECPLNSQLDNTVFTSHKIINKSEETLDSFMVSLWVDFDLGCYLDDYMGSSPEQNAFFAYNSDALDGESSPNDCSGVDTYGYEVPAQSVQFLNKKMDFFMMHGGNTSSGCFPSNDMGPPGSPIHYFNLMNAKWRDGTPLTYGGTGYDNQGTSEVTNYIYPGNPNLVEEWSLYQEGAPGGDPRTKASHYQGTFSPNEEIVLDIAYTFHKKNAIPDHLEIVNQMYLDIDKVKQMYDAQFNGWCEVATETEELSKQSFSISPNPSTGIFHLKTDFTEIEGLKVFDLNGRLVWQDSKQFIGNRVLPLDFLNSGIYILQFESNEGLNSKKLVIQK